MCPFFRSDRREEIILYSLDKPRVLCYNESIKNLEALLCLREKSLKRSDPF